jgi:hypothetical protein
MGKKPDHDCDDSVAKYGEDKPSSSSAKHTSIKAWMEDVSEFAYEALEESKMEAAERRQTDLEWEQSKREAAAAKRSSKEAEKKRIKDNDIKEAQKQKEVSREPAVVVDSWDYY